MPDRVARQDARQRGIEAEAQTAEALVSDGWRVLDRNWRGGPGELDLVACRGDVLRFVEVKRRTDDVPDVISPTQVRRLRATAEAWMQDQPSVWWSEACFWLVVHHDGAPPTWTLDPF